MKLGKESRKLVEKAMHGVEIQRALIAKIQKTSSATMNECGKIAQGLRVAAATIEQVDGRLFYAQNKDPSLEKKPTKKKPATRAVKRGRR